MSAPLPPDPKPGYKTTLKRLLEKIDRIDPYTSEHDYTPKDTEQLVEIGELPDDVLRIYVAYQDGLDSYIEHVRAIQKEQSEWVERAPNITSRTMRAYLVRQIGQTQEIEDEYIDLKLLRSMMLDEFDELFPEVELEDNDKFVVIGRSLFVVLTSLDNEGDLDYVRFYPETLKHLGLEEEPPEHME